MTTRTDFSEFHGPSRTYSEVFTTGGSLERLAGGKFLLGHYSLHVFDSDIKKGDQQGQLVNGHVLQHSLSVALKAFTKRFRCVGIGIVGDKGNVTTVFGLILARLVDELANVLVVSHQDGDTGRLGLLTHGLQFLDGGRTRLFQVNAGATGGHALGEQARIVRRATTDQRQALFSRLGQVRHLGKELHAVLLLRLFLVRGKLGASGPSGS